MKNVRKNLTLSLLLVFLLIGGKLTIEAQSVLSAGDIAFLGLYTGGSAGNGDAFTFITLKELSPGTIIYFTDEGWNNGAWGGSPSEGHFTWSPPAGGTPIGTIVTITGGANQSVPGTPSVGTCSSSFLSGTTWHFPTGEEIIAYQSTSGARPASPTFIAGMLVYYNSNFYNSSTKWCTSIPDGYTELASTLPNGLINGTNSISVCNSSYPTTARNCRYNGLLAGTASTVRALINNDANWTRSSTNPFDITSSAFSSPAVTADPLAPSATTNAATSVTTSGAMLNGNINANGSSTTVTFEYGLTASYGLTVTATQSPVSGSVSTAVSKALTGLSSNTTYHYRVKCTNAGGTTYGTDQTFTTLSAAPTAEVPSGTGTSSDPYLISNLYELYWIAEQISLNVSNGEYFIGKYFKQTANIDASATSTWFGGKGWLPIGYFDEATNNYEDFGGNYDGQGFTVSNIYINRPTETNAGLFGSVTNGVVRNLGVTNLSIQANNQTGGLIGYLYGTNTIENCYTTGTISCSGEYVAGLVGFNDGTNTINSCYSECNVTGASYVAGIYSQCSSPGSVTSNCHSSGTITSTALNGTAGGLIAYAYGTVRNCYSSANVVSSNGYCGGLIQINYSNVSNCYATGSVNGKTYSGGFVGTNGDSYTITDCYSTGSVTASNSSGTSIGGFAGVNIGTITNCYTTSSVNSVAANTGGFVGDNFISVKSVVNNSFWNSDVYTNGFGRNAGVFSALGKTTSQMKTTSTFTTPGWDFSGETTNGTNDYWGRADDKNSGYPFLKWQYPSAPEINITGNNITIADGDATPSTTDYTDFGSVAVASGTIWREFRIWNTGTSALNLTGSPIVVSSSGEFIISQPIMSTIDPGGGSITFRVIFDPSASGVRTATLSIANNDADENPYNFSIQGTGSVVAPTVTTQAVSSITSTTATGNGNVTVTGGANITERGIYYSTTSGFADGTGTKVSTTGDWSTTGVFTQAINGLSAGTTYYVKAFATNAAGTSYGGEVTFATLASAPTITSTPKLTAPYNVPYSYSIVASIENDLETNLTATTKPAWLSFSTDGQNQASLFGNIPAGKSLSGVAGDTEGNTYSITSNGTEIYKIAADGTTTLWKSGLISGEVYALHIANGYIYIPRYRNNNQSITRIPLSNSSAAEETFATLTGGALSLTDKDGWIYAADWNNAKISRINEATKENQLLLSSTNGVPYNGPFGLTFGDDGNLYIATWHNRSIIRYDGTKLLTGSPGTPTTLLSGLPNSVSSIRQDRNGNFYLSMYNSGVRKYTSDFSSFQVVSLSATDDIWSLSLTASGALVYSKFNTNEVYRLQTGAILTGTPAKSDVGDHSVVLRATNSSGFTEQSFTIKVVDSVAPVITAKTPANGTIDVALKPTISITFDEVVSLGDAGTLTLYNGSTLLKSFDLSVPAEKALVVLSENKLSLSIALSENLPDNTVVTVGLSSGFVKDVHNNNFAGFTAASNSWSFTTKFLPTVTLTGSTGGTTLGQNSPVYIASDANVTGTTLNGAIASIGSNFNSAQDVLGIDGLQSGTSGSISYSYDSSKGVLTLTGDANVATYQSIIRKITYTNTSATPSTASRSITISLNKALPYSGNGHFFEFVANSGITWTNAKAAAEGLNYFGLRGYLATITSAEENAFCLSKLTGEGWIGASDETVEGTWRWVTGPESGNLLSYTNWSSSEPNNLGNEDYAHFLLNGKWNDYPNYVSSISGYVVEYGGSAGDPVLDVTDVVTVNITAPANVTSVSVPSNGTYRGGNILNFNVTFSESINVVTTGGTPYIPITLNTGGTVNATYVSGGGTTSLLFSYQIVTDNLDLDGITVGSAITANGGTLKNAGGFDANLTLNSVGSTTSVLVDAVAPSVSSVSSTTANGTYKEGDVIAITILFSENVTVTGTPILLLNSGGTAYYSSGSGSSLLTFNYTVGSGQSSADLDYNAISSMYLSGGSILDAAGNATWLNLPTVGGVNSLGGQKDIIIAIKPAVMTGEAVSIASTTATIKGTVKANDASSVVTFEYGLTNSYGSSVFAVQSPMTGNTSTSVSGLLTGLIPNATYHYRVKAVNAVGTTIGADSVFTTLPASSTTFTGTGIWSEMERWSAGIPGTITATTISGTCTATDNYEVASLLINSGKLTINPDKTLKVTGSFVNNVGANAFILKSDATGTGKLVNNSTGVQATVQQYFVKNQWHYYTTPVSSSVNAFPLLYNLWAVDHDEKSNSWSFMNSANIINTGKGYGARYSSSSGNDTLITITGALNAGNKVIQAKKEGDGWNLIGNPYPSTADWANGILRDNVYNAIYLWNPVTSNYGYFVDGVSVNGQTQYIAPMQGFFVKATAEGSVTFTDATKSITPSYFRNAESQTLIRLQLKSDKNLSDETVIRVKFGATDKFDAEMDANKLISTESGIPQIFTQIALEEYAVNTISQINEGLKVPVKIMLSGAGKYIISISELKDFDSGLPVYMFDTKNRKLINLLNENIEFETNVSETIETYLLFTNTPTSTIEENTHNITVFSKHKSLVVEGMSKSPHEIQVYTLDGVLVFKQSVNTGKIDIPVKSEGIYAVKIIPENGNVFNSKVVVR